MFASPERCSTFFCIMASLAVRLALLQQYEHVLLSSITWCHQCNMLGKSEFRESSNNAKILVNGNVFLVIVITFLERELAVDFYFL